MAEAEESKEEYYIRLLTFIIGPATEVLQLYFEIKVLNSLDFFIFLENHKHVLFHELYPSIPCCECKKVLLAAPQKKCRLNDTQFHSLFETDEGQEVEDHNRKRGRQIKQLCICSVSAKRTTSVVLMDITLLSSLIKSCCHPWSISGNPNWIKDIKNTRNFIAHSPSNRITKSVFDQKFALVEQSVLNIANVLGPVHQNMIKRQISIFKNSNLWTLIDNEVTQNNNDSIHKILEMFVEEQTRTLESFAYQTKNLVKNSQEIQTEMQMCSSLQEHKGLNFSIRNVLFKVKTLWKDVRSRKTDPFKRGFSHDDDVCYVEWTLSTPGNWNVDEIKETLEKFSSLMGKFFRIEFVYKGSLVIQTSAQLRFLQRDFKLAVKSFLKDFLDICNLDTDSKIIVQVKIAISKEKFESKNFVSKKIDTSWLTCDPCSNLNVSSEAIQFCSECQFKLCRQCVSNHNLNSEFFVHHLTELEILSHENFCVKHDGSILDFFCIVHDCLCCLSCKTEEHQSCQNVLPLEDAAKDMEHSVMFQDVSHSVSNITTTLNRAITSRDVNIENLQDDESTISFQLALYKSTIIKRLDEFERDIIFETRSLKNEQSAYIESDKNMLLQIKRPINEISRRINQASKYGSQRQLFVLINKYTLDILDLEIKLQTILPTLMTRRMTFQPQKDIRNTIKYLGSTRLNTSQYNADHKQSNIQQVCVSQIPPTFTFNRKLEIKGSDDIQNTIKSLGSTRPNKQPHIQVSVSEMPTTFTFNRKLEIKGSDAMLIRKMDITNDNRLLLCDYSGTNLLVYSVWGGFLQHGKLSDRPWDIAIIPGENKAVVTLPDESSIQFIDIETMKAGPVHSLPFACRRVSIVNREIYVSGHRASGYRASRNVHILDMRGKSINTLEVPNAACITSLHQGPGPDKSFYYTDAVFNAVCHCTLDGKERSRYTSKNLKKPNAFASDRTGNLYVACADSNNIQRTTPNGEFFDIILNAENDIYSPTDILFSNDNQELFVLNHVEDNTYVLVFTCS